MFPLKHKNKDSRFQTIPQVACDYSLSENTIRKYLKEMPKGIARKYGRSIRVDRPKFDEEMELLSE